MNTLFPIDSFWPKGFDYKPEFITTQEENELLDLIRTMDLHTFNFHGYEAKRKVASFGQDWSFEKQRLSRGKEIPISLRPVMEKVASYLALKAEDFAEILITEYPVGSVINWHRDAPPFDLIAGISLLSDCSFRFKPYDKKKQTRASVIPIPVSRRSLYIMKDESRTDWQHSIAPVKKIRYSITLRTLKKIV